MATDPTQVAARDGGAGAGAASGSGPGASPGSGSGVSTAPGRGATSGPMGAEVELQAGDMAGGYQIEKKLGEGGFGTVYAAIHPMIGKNAAVKVLNRQCSSNPEMVSRFAAEARAVNQIRHKNIIDIFDFGTLVDGRQFYVMELLEGRPLDGHLDQVGRMTVSDAIPILRAIAKAIDAAHATGIAHRDLKPENIFLVRDEDGGFTPKLLDFGIAKLLIHSTESQHKTRTGTPMGTPYYMSPEQCRGVNVDHRTDIYSFGVMVHRMLTGEMLFDAESAMDLMMAHVGQPPPPMSTVFPSLRPELDPPVLHMLQKDPSKRPASIAGAVEELAEAARQAGYTVPGGSTLSSLGTHPSASNVVIDGDISRQTPRHAPLQREFGEARTMVNTSAGLTNSTLPPVGSGVAKRPAWVVPVAGAVVLLGLTGVGLAMKSKASTSSANAAVLTTTSATSTTASTNATNASNAAVSPITPDTTGATPPSSALAPAAEIAITLDTKPAGADVFLGDAKIGVSPGPIHLPRGTEKLTLTVRSTGYVTKSVEVTPAVNATLEVTLVKDPKSAGAAGGPAGPSGAGGKKPSGTNPALENPF